MAKKFTHTKFTQQDRIDIAQRVFDHMAKGLSLRKACETVGVNVMTVGHWIDADPELQLQYTRARESLHDYIAQEIMDIADADPRETPSGQIDPAAVQKQKLQIESRKWLLSKVAPKKYGDKLELSGDKENPLKIEQTIDVSKLSTQALAEIIAVKDANGK